MCELYDTKSGQSNVWLHVPTYLQRDIKSTVTNCCILCVSHEIVTGPSKYSVSISKIEVKLFLLKSLFCSTVLRKAVIFPFDISSSIAVKALITIMLDGDTLHCKIVES